MGEEEGRSNPVDNTKDDEEQGGVMSRRRESILRNRKYEREDTTVCDTHETKEEIRRVAKMKIKRKRKYHHFAPEDEEGVLNGK